MVSWRGIASFISQRKMQLTLVYFAAFMALGMALASLGPTIPDLRLQTNTTLSTQSFVGAARAAGYLAGAGAHNGFLFFSSLSTVHVNADAKFILFLHFYSYWWSSRRFSRWQSGHGGFSCRRCGPYLPFSLHDQQWSENFVLFWFCKIGTAVVPLSASVWMEGLFIILQGVAMGFLDSGANLMLIVRADPAELCPLTCRLLSCLVSPRCRRQPLHAKHALLLCIWCFRGTIAD